MKDTNRKIGIARQTTGQEHEQPMGPQGWTRGTSWATMSPKLS